MVVEPGPYGPKLLDGVDRADLTELVAQVHLLVPEVGDRSSAHRLGCGQRPCVEAVDVDDMALWAAARVTSSSRRSHSST